MSSKGNEAGHTLFISDLHLCSSRPAITEQFIRFMENRATRADALYVLGDLFEYWAGDEEIGDEHHRRVVLAFAALADAGIPCFFIHGNRDFLISQGFSSAARVTLLSDPAQLTLYGRHILLSHGDALCTDDRAYQAFRQQVRNENWQRSFLAQPLQVRKAQIEALRTRSEQEKSYKAESIMDVNPDAVAGLLRAHAYPELFIHGHTHRPDVHDIEVDGHRIQRWVLGDWYEQGSCLQLDATGCRPVLLD
ncbi:UDP-2,3-diacylglucosamine hydrolase [Methylophilaceae bacterium]|nr:UDP-2,3-diacylglucosamine hydrolase [Methylophilaceae bacterium]